MNIQRTVNNTLGSVVIPALLFVCIPDAACGEGSDFPDGTEVITTLPYSDTGDTSDNTDIFDASGQECFGSSESPDVFYELSGDLGDITVTLCDSSYDTKLYIFSLDSGFDLFACNSDACGEEGFRSQLDAKLVAGTTYFLAVDGDFGEAGEYTLTVDAFEPPEPCDPPCPAGSTQNDEPCDVTDDTGSNGGCETGVPYVPITENEVVCGTVWAFNNERDSDWYGYTHGGGMLEWTVNCGAPCVAFILTPETECSNIAVLASGDSGGATCGSAVASADLSPETYGLFVSVGGAGGTGIFDGYPCNSGFNAYTASVSAGPPPPPPCITDFDGNGATDFQDLLQLLSNFGACPE